MADAYKQLVIDFIAKTDKFVSQTNVAATSLNKFSAQAKRLGSTLTGGLIGAGVAASFMMIGRSIKNAMQDMDDLAKTSRRLGIAASEYQSLGLAAELSGSSIEKVTKGVDILSRRIGELSLGASDSKVTETLFGKLGLSADALNDMGKIDQLRALSAGLRGIETQSERTAVMMGLFGRSGAELTLLFQDLGPALDRAAKSVKGLMSDEDLARIEEANDRLSESWVRLKNSWYGVINIFADYSEFMGKAVQGKHFDAPPVKASAEALALVAEEEKRLAEEQAKINEVMMRGAERLEGMITPAEKYKQAVHDINEEFAAGAYGEGGAEKWASALELARTEFERVDPESIARKKAMEEDLRAQEAYAAQMQSLGESYTLANQTPTEKYMTEIMKLNQVLAAGTITQDTYARAVANAKNQLSEASGETQRLSELQAWMNVNYESTRTPYEKYLGEMQMLNEAMMAGIGSPDLWNRIAMQAEQSLMGAMGNVADAMPGMFGGAPWMQGPLPMNGFGGSSPPGMSMIYPMGGAATPHTPGTAGMATASQIAGVLRGGTSGDTGKQQLAELKRTNTFLERIVYENAGGFRL